MEGLGEMIPQKKLSKVEERVDFPNSQSTRYVLAMVEGNVWDGLIYGEQNGIAGDLLKVKLLIGHLGGEWHAYYV